MQIKDVPIVDLSTLRRDLYFVMSLLLADKEVAKEKDMVAWTDAFFESKVCGLVMRVSTAVRSLLDFLKEKDDGFSRRHCGEYWADFEEGEKAPLTLRQACNSSIHAKEALRKL